MRKHAGMEDIMETNLRAHMDELFRDVPISKQSVEIKEEILQNITDKYHDLLAEGKSEEAAYNIAVASIGDLTNLLESLKGAEPEQDTSLIREYNNWKKKSALRIAIAVMLYILCVIPPIITDMIGESYENIGAIGLFVIAAIATAILVFNALSKPVCPSTDGSIAKEFKKWQEQKDNDKQALKAIKSAMWSILLILYFVISFATGAWAVTWVIFLIGGAGESIIRAVFTLKN
jgi:hypothetical protein